MRIQYSIIVASALCGFIFRYEAGEVKPGEDAVRVQRLLADLNADDFDAREKAERELNTHGGAALPALLAAFERAESVEVKMRLGRIVPCLVIENETDPEKLMELARTTAEKELFAIAAQGYLRAVDCYEVKLRATKTTQEFSNLRVHEIDALRRSALMDVAQTCGKSVRRALAANYSKLTVLPENVTSMNTDMVVSDFSELAKGNVNLGRVIKELLTVHSSGTSGHVCETRHGKLFVSTSAEMQAFITAFLYNLRERK